MLPLKIAHFRNVEPDQTDFASTFVALNNQFFQILTINFSIDYSVDVLGFVFRRYDDSATGTREVSFSLNFGQVHLVYER